FKLNAAVASLAHRVLDRLEQSIADALTTCIGGNRDRIEPGKSPILAKEHYSGPDHVGAIHRYEHLGAWISKMPAPLPGAYVIRDKCLSFEVKQGREIALTAKSDADKSTLGVLGAHGGEPSGGAAAPQLSTARTRAPVSNCAPLTCRPTCPRTVS